MSPPRLGSQESSSSAISKNYTLHVEMIKNIFHVQVEVGFWKFEYFQFYFILTIRLNPAFLCPNCFQTSNIIPKISSMYAASLRDTFGYLQRMFSTSRMSGKVQIAKYIFHVQVEVGFWKFEYFQFHFILTARLNPTFLGPYCFQNIRCYSKNMRNLFCEVRRYF